MRYEFHCVVCNKLCRTRSLKAADSGRCLRHDGPNAVAMSRVRKRKTVKKVRAVTPTATKSSGKPKRKTA